jgi:glycosyltransferase domain-containing protein
MFVQRGKRMMRDDATIVVPTFNRASTLNRLIRFLELLDCPFPVLVLDGSTPEVAAANRHLQEKFKFVSVRSYPSDLHLGLRCADGLTYVRTRYAVMCGDDDFVVPSGISSGCSFLDQEARDVAVIGRVLALRYDLGRAYTSSAVIIQDLLPLGLNLSYESFIQRASALSISTTVGCPPLYYSLVRTDVLREAYKCATDEMKFTSLELLINLSIVAEGYARSLPGLFAFRDYANAPLRQEIRQNPNHYFGLADLDGIQRVIAAKVSEKENLSNDIASYVAELAVRNFVPKLTSLPSNVTKSTFSRLIKMVANSAARAASLVAPGVVAMELNFEREVMRALMIAQGEFVKSVKSA